MRHIPTKINECFSPTPSSLYPESHCIVATICSSHNLGHEKKKPCFTGGRTCQVGSIGRAIFSIFIFLNLWFQKITPNTRKFRENFDIFCRIILGNIETSCQEILAKIFQIFVKKWLILQDFGKNKKIKILPKRKFGSVAPVKRGFIFL